jgi:hypothetical protein
MTNLLPLLRIEAPPKNGALIFFGLFLWLGVMMEVKH